MEKYKEALKIILTFKPITGETRKNFKGYTYRDALERRKNLYTHKEALEQIFALIEKTLSEEP